MHPKGKCCVFPEEHICHPLVANHLQYLISHWSLASCLLIHLFPEHLVPLCLQVFTF